MSDLDKFNDYYKSRVKDTGERAIIRQINGAPPTMVGAGYKDPAHMYVEETSEKVIGVYLTESMFIELVNNSVQSIEELEMRRRNPELYRLYHQYKMMVNLYK